MISVIKNFPVVIHQLFFLFAQLLILKVYGIGYSGSLAYVGTVSTFLAVIINLRSDIEIMIRSSQALYESLLDATGIILFMTLFILMLNIIFGSPISIYIIYSGIAIAMHELLVSILFVQKRIFTYSIFRTIPAIALIFFASIGYSAEIIWPAAFFVSVLFLLIYLKDLFKKAFRTITLNRIKKIKLIERVNASITATTFSFFAAFFVIIINFYFGDEYVGIWSNTMRIFNSLILFFLAACIPFMLNTIRDQDLDSQKIKAFFNLWILFIPLILFSYIVVSYWGVFIFSLMQSFDFEISNAQLRNIFLIGVAISFIGSSQGLYQALNQSIALLVMIFATVVIGLIFVYELTFSFAELIEIFLFLLFALVMMILVHLSFYLIYKK
jgi:hypothetical protein